MAGSPKLVATEPADGSTVQQVSQIVLTADQPVSWTNVSVVKFDGTTTTLGDGAGTTITRAYQATDPGEYVVHATLADGIGPPVEALVHFTIPPAQLQGLPPVEKNVFPGQAGNSTDPTDGVTVAWPASAADDEAVLSIVPSDLPRGVGGSGVAVKVTMYHRRDGSLITSFADPLDIAFDSTAAGDTAYYSQNDVDWTQVDSIPSQVLPATMQQGFYFDGRKGHLLTRHLTYFAVMHSAGAAQTKLVMTVTSTKQLEPKTQKQVAVRIKVSAASNVTAKLFSARGLHLYTWRFSVHAGASIVKLPWPAQVRRPGVYTVSWLADANGQITKRMTHIRIVGKKIVNIGSGAGAPEVVLDGSDQLRRNLALGLGPSDTHVIKSVPDDTFALAGASNRNVQVIVVDVDQYRLSFVHDLRTVFPELKIVALSNDPALLSRAVPAGATVALPTSTPPQVLAKIVRRLLSTGRP